MSDWLEAFWEEALSREPVRVRAALDGLDDDEERAAVIAHLRRMATEEGWSEPQRLSAQAALQAIEDAESPRQD